MKKTLLFLLILIKFLNTVDCQPCYKIVADPTGYNASALIASLQDSSCQLISEFPTEFQSQFKVYDFGFYIQNEYMQGEFQEIWNKTINDISNETPYYLVFGRQLPNSEGKSDIWVEINLPSTGSFSCIEDISSGYMETIKYKISTVAKIEFQKEASLPNSYYLAESKAISTLIKIVRNIVSCCDPGLISSSCNTCLFTSDEVISYLELNNFIKFPITIPENKKLQNFDCGNDSLYVIKNNDLKHKINTFNSSVVNYTDYNIYIDGEEINIENLIEEQLGLSGFGDFTVYIMDYGSIINNLFYENVEAVKESKGGLIYFIDNYSEKSFLYISPTSFDINLHLEQSYNEEILQYISSSSTCEGCPDWMLEIYNDGYSEFSSPLIASVIAPALPLAAVDGPAPIADVIIAAAAAAVATYEVTQRIFVTYIAFNPLRNQHYCGRTSGFGTPGSVLDSRINSHHVITKGYQVSLDRSMQDYPSGYWCIRGREQQNIDFYGGALSESDRPPNATCVNSIRGVAKYNPFGGLYHWASSTAWGEKHPYTGYGATDIEELWEDLKQLKRMKDWFKF